MCSLQPFREEHHKDNESVSSRIRKLCTAVLRELPYVANDGEAARIQRTFHLNLLQLSSHSSITHTDLSALIHSVAQVFAAADKSCQKSDVDQRQLCRQQAQDCLFKVMQSHANLLWQVSRSDASQILRSFAQTGFNMDATLPGSTAKLVRKVAASGSDTPASLQQIVDTISAMARYTDAGKHAHTMASKRDVKALCTQYIKLIRQAKVPEDMSTEEWVHFWTKEPPGQMMSEFLCSAAKLQLSLESAALDDLCDHFVAHTVFAWYGTGHIISDALRAFDQLDYKPGPTRLKSLVAARRKASWYLGYQLIFFMVFTDMLWYVFSAPPSSMP